MTRPCTGGSFGILVVGWGVTRPVVDDPVGPVLDLMCPPRANYLEDHGRHDLIGAWCSRELLAVLMVAVSSTSCLLLVVFQC